MQNYRDLFKKYLDDLAAKQPSPGGGSAICLIFCLGTSLIEMAMKYSENKSKDFSKHIETMAGFQKEVYPYIDLDARIFEKIMKATTPKEKLEYIKDSEKLTVYLGLACHQAFLLAKKIESDIKDSIKSDFSIGIDCLKVTLRGCILNLEANSKIFGEESEQVKVLKNYLEKWE